MTSRDESKLNMYHSVQQFCNENQLIWTDNAAFTDAFDNFNSLLADILAVTSIQSNILTGIAHDKEDLRKQLCQTATDIAGMVSAFATKGGNNQLKESVSFSFSDLKQLKDELLVPTATNIYNAANANKTALADYGVTDAMLTNFNTRIAAYSEAVSKPKTALAQKKTATGNLKNLFEQVDSILKERMDKLVPVFKNHNPDFVSSYGNTRTIYDAASKSKKPITQKPV